MNSTQRAIDAAVDFIRRFRGGATQATPSSFGYRLGDDVADAVPPAGTSPAGWPAGTQSFAVDPATGRGPGVPVGNPYSQKRGDMEYFFGPEYELDYEAAGMQPPLDAEYVLKPSHVPDAMLAPKAVAASAGAGAAAGQLGQAVSDLFGEEPAVTSGGTAELAAEVPPLVVADDAPVVTPAKPARPPSAVDSLPLNRRNKYYRQKELEDSGMRPEDAAAAVLEEERAARRSPPQGPMPGSSAASTDSEGRPSLPPADGLRQAVGRGSLYPEEADLLAREAEMEKSAAELGMPQQQTLPQHWRDAAAGNDMVGRFRFVHSPTGLRAIDTSPTEAEQQAAFRKWANAEPGSDRQATYSPQGKAEWDAKIAATLSRQAQAELAMTPEERAARKASEVSAAKQNKGIRGRVAAAAIQRRKDEEALLSPQQKAARDNRIMMQQNPFITLGDSRLNDWQQFVLSQNMLRGAEPRVTDPNAVQAQQLNNIGDVIKRSLTAAAQGLQPQAVTDAQAAAAGVTTTLKENELPVEDHVALERERGGGVIRGSTSAGRRLLQQISDAYVGGMYATTQEVNDAVAEAVRQGIPSEDAEAFFKPRRRTLTQWATGS